MVQRVLSTYSALRSNASAGFLHYQRGKDDGRRDFRARGRLRGHRLRTSAKETDGGYMLNGSSDGSRTAEKRTTTSSMRLPRISWGERDRSACCYKNLPGVSFGQSERLRGFRGIPSADVYLDNVEVPVENLVVPPGEFGLPCSLRSLSSDSATRR